MKQTRQIKDLRHKAIVKYVSKTITLDNVMLWLCPELNDWFILHNDTSLIGSTPSGWDDVKKSLGYAYSFGWFIGTNSEKLLLDCIHISADFAETKKKKTFKVGDKVHILSRELMEQINGRPYMSLSGSFYDREALVRSESKDNGNTVFYLCDITKENGQTLYNYGVDETDLYEFHGLTPPAKTKIMDTSGSLLSGKKDFMKGDRVRILTKSDCQKYNGRETLNLAVHYYGYYAEIVGSKTVLSHTSDSIYYRCNILDDSGKILTSGLGVDETDLYEYHGIFSIEPMAVPSTRYNPNTFKEIEVPKSCDNIVVKTPDGNYSFKVDKSELPSHNSCIKAEINEYDYRPSRRTTDADVQGKSVKHSSELEESLYLEL